MSTEAPSSQALTYAYDLGARFGARYASVRAEEPSALRLYGTARSLVEAGSSFEDEVLESLAADVRTEVQRLWMVESVEAFRLAFATGLYDRLVAARPGRACDGTLPTWKDRAYMALGKGVWRALRRVKGWRDRGGE